MFDGEDVNDTLAAVARREPQWEYFACRETIHHMTLQGKQIGILLENGFEEREIWYYTFRFAEEGATIRFLTRLWGHSELTFKGMEYGATLRCTESLKT